MLVADHLQPAARKAGISCRIGFHTLRRTLACALIAVAGRRNGPGDDSARTARRCWRRLLSSVKEAPRSAECRMHVPLPCSIDGGKVSFVKKVDSLLDTILKHPKVLEG